MNRWLFRRRFHYLLNIVQWIVIWKRIVWDVWFSMKLLSLSRFRDEWIMHSNLKERREKITKIRSNTVSPSSKASHRKTLSDGRSRVLFEVMRHSYETVWKERLLYYVGVLVHFSHVLVDLFVFFIIELSFLYFNREMRVFYCIILSLLFCFCLSYRHVVVLFFVFIFRFFSISTGFTMI